MKGIVLAGNSGTKLYPLTIGVPKQLLPVYDKPMIYYPIETLKESGISDILVITTTEQQNAFYKYLGDGSKLNVSISYAIQDDPRGIAEAITIAKDFLSNDDICLITGDTIIVGNGIYTQLKKAFKAVKKSGNATIFVSRDTEGEQYGKVVDNQVVGNSNSYYFYSITGLYVFPHIAVEKVKKVAISERGLLEITSLSRIFQEEEKLQIQEISTDCEWLDTNTFDNLLKCSQQVQIRMKDIKSHKI